MENPNGPIGNRLNQLRHRVPPIWKRKKKKERKTPLSRVTK